MPLDNQDQETFLVPSADKQTRIKYTLSTSIIHWYKVHWYVTFSLTFPCQSSLDALLTVPSLADF